jgi:hypothetical protein
MMLDSVTAFSLDSTNSNSSAGDFEDRRCHIIFGLKNRFVSRKQYQI